MEGAEIRSSREGDEKKKKKKKKKRSRLDVKVESISESKDKIAPFVGYFPSGFDPLKHRQLKQGPEEEEEEEQDPKIRVFRNEKFSSRLQLVVSPKGSKVDFVGTSHTGEAAAPQVCTYAVGILDKEKQSLRIVPIAANKIFRLEPRIRGAPQAPELNEELATEKSVTKRDLTDLYGTKEAKSRLRKWDAIRQKEGDAEAQKVTEGKIEDIKIDKDSLEVDNLHVDNIPPYDVTATSPEKAYLLDKIILKGDWDHLSDIYELIMQSGGDAASAVEFCRKNNYPSFVCNRLLKLALIQDDDEKSKFAGIFSYISHLVKFKNLPHHHRNSMPAFLNSAVNHYSIPITLFQKFVKMFVDSNADRQTDEKLDLLISYILVLTLFADGFETDISDIASDLKMTPMNLKRHYRHLGCKLSSPRGLGWIKATLPIPLKLPLLMKMARRR